MTVQFMVVINHKFGLVMSAATELPLLYIEANRWCGFGGWGWGEVRKDRIKN